MKTVRIFVLSLSLIIAGMLFTTGSAYAAGNGSKGGDTTCVTQLNPYGHPIVRCTDEGGKKDDSSAAPVKHVRHHHIYHRHHRFYHAWRHYHFHHHYSHHYSHHTSHHHHH